MDGEGGKWERLVNKVDVFSPGSAGSAREHLNIRTGQALTTRRVSGMGRLEETTPLPP